MMDKNSAEGHVCAFCSNEAIPGTNPPVCSDHLLSKEANEAVDGAADADEAKTLKELENKD